MPFFRTSGGSFLEIDLPDPRNPHAVERHEHALAVGNIVEVDGSTLEAVTVDGATKLVPKPAAAPSRRARRTEPEVDPKPLPVVEDPAPEEG